MTDPLAERLVGGPFADWFITDAEPSFEFFAPLSYTFAIEMQIAVTACGKPAIVSMWATYDYDSRRAEFNDVTWAPPTNAVVVTEIRDTPPWK